jgi:hypothetical protein
MMRPALYALAAGLFLMASVPARADDLTDKREQEQYDIDEDTQTVKNQVDAQVGIDDSRNLEEYEEAAKRFDSARKDARKRLRRERGEVAEDTGQPPSVAAAPSHAETDAPEAAPPADDGAANEDETEAQDYGDEY